MSRVSLSNDTIHKPVECMHEFIGYELALLKDTSGSFSVTDFHHRIKMLRTHSCMAEPHSRTSRNTVDWARYREGVVHDD
jgi:hypothetical protein